jgi:COP9 signalosome complex subunit 4
MSSPDQIRASMTQIMQDGKDATERLAAFSALVKSLMDAKDVSGIKILVQQLLAEEGQYSLFSRPVLSEIAKAMETLDNVNLKDLSLSLIETLKRRVVSFEEEDAVIRSHLADVFQAEGEYTKAAQCLAQINLESGTRIRTAQEKSSFYVRIAELYLEDEDPVTAENFCSRAGMVIHDVEDVSLCLRYKVCYARILDSKRKFQDAAQKYTELAQTTDAGVAHDDLMALLSCAVVCAILAPAGPQRARTLATLCKDERISSVQHYDILKKVFLGRIIRANEVRELHESLAEHQKATGPDGQTVLERAMLQHNMLAASRVYKNMRLEDLGRIMEVQPARAEKMAAKMINEKRLQAYIDQRKGAIHFESGTVLGMFDQSITHITTRVNTVFETISAKA